MKTNPKGLDKNHPIGKIEKKKKKKKKKKDEVFPQNKYTKMERKNKINNK